jgi:hypothetical protein
MSFLDIVLGILDIRLSKYMTPYIVRLYWILALVVAVLYLVDFSLQVIATGASGSQPKAAAEDFGELFRRSAAPSGGRESFADSFSWFKSLVVRVIGVFCLVLAVRVWCEILVVAFNMANSLRSIDARMALLNEQNERAGDS